MSINTKKDRIITLNYDEVCVLSGLLLFTRQCIEDDFTRFMITVPAMSPMERAAIESISEKLRASSNNSAPVASVNLIDDALARLREAFADIEELAFPDRGRIS